MPGKTSIEWTDVSWNPVTGCTQVSAGCDHCYAMTFAERFRGVPGHPYEQGFDLKLWPDRLTVPLKWRKPRRVFVNSMSDLFHADVPEEFIDRVFGVMAAAQQHTFQILTKRPQRAYRYLNRVVSVTWPGGDAVGVARLPDQWPLPNVWIGTSVESQEVAWRLDWLTKTPATVRFVSAEPLLGPLDLRPWLYKLGWVIVGGESGHGFRPLDPEWAVALRDQCVAAGVPFFFKQHGGRTPKAGGRLLDGQTWDQFPRMAERAVVLGGSA